MNLDNLNAIKKLDKNNVAESIANLPKQLMASWESAKKIKLPATLGKADNIIFCGMGGSNLASELLRSVFSSQLKVPMILIRDYSLPALATKNSLIIIDSYSGNTEEVLACLNQAMKLKAKIICIASGGKIELIAKRNRLVLFKLNPNLNPSGQPRYDLGSQLGEALFIFSKLKFIAVSDKELSEISLRLVTLGQNLLPLIKQKDNPAKRLAQKLADKSLSIVGAEHLSASAHIMANQINESAKQLANPFKLPELNHHFLEALAFPKRAMRDNAFVFLASADYGERLSKRIIATKKILDQKNILHQTIITESTGALSQALEILAIAGWVSFYLAMLNQVNPAEIPWVKYFKEELEK